LKIGVIGAGAWGTALAKLLTEKGLDVTLWCREDDVRGGIELRKENARFLPGIPLPAGLKASASLDEAARGASILLLSVPSPYMRSVLSELAPLARGIATVVSATKGLEEKTHFRMSEVVAQTLGGIKAVVLSGPTFAREVALGEPTALVAASADLDEAKEVQSHFSTSAFRVYTNDDTLGVELGGALKNVIALAAGVATGLGLGHNPRAALMTRGLAEIARLVEAMGGRRDTLFGLAGMGDLVLTCTGHLSRNRQVGIELGKGRALEEILAGMEQVVEGVRTTHAAVALAREHGVEMPIVLQMERLLRGETTPGDVMRELMTRPLKGE
jgi:glycerol-3-phosphate dehydrogenase (NAD(P)+)